MVFFSCFCLKEIFQKIITDAVSWNEPFVKEDALSGLGAEYIILFGDNRDDEVGSWVVKSNPLRVHSMLVNLPSANPNRSVNPLVDVIMVPREVNNLVSLKIVNWLLNIF